MKSMLQHVRAIDPTVRMKGNIKVSLDEANMKKISTILVQFFKKAKTVLNPKNYPTFGSFLCLN